MASFHLRTCRRALCGWVAVLAGLLVGCGSSKPDPTGLPHDVDWEALASSIAELELGSYRIASAVREQSLLGDATRPTWVHIRFQLYALATPEDAKLIQKLVSRRRGEIDDTVVTVCRSASIEEISDIRTAALKHRLKEALRPILGEHRIRQLSFADTFQWEPI